MLISYFSRSLKSKVCWLKCHNHFDGGCLKLKHKKISQEDLNFDKSLMKLQINNANLMSGKYKFQIIEKETKKFETLF